MAEDERIWLQKHSHESNTLSKGSFGTATYEEEREWTFLRDDQLLATTHETDFDADEQSTTALRFISGPELIIGKSYHSDSPTAQSGAKVAGLPTLAPSLYITESIARRELQHDLLTRHGQRTAFGSAVWLGMGGVDSGNLTVPAAAFVIGPGRDRLRLVCAGSQLFYDNDSGTELRIPSLIGESQVTWIGTEPIEQVVFSTSLSQGHGDTFLAVRRYSSTCILEPLLRRDASQPASSSPLDPNVLLELSTSFTGGATHADICFDPLHRRRFAIVDTEGNWSVWKINGNRSHTARVLYQARLKCSGKIFSWEHKGRPDGVELYFDGWHRVLWASSNGKDTDRLLVCNRQHAKLFNPQGDELDSVDVRLDSRKMHSSILDVRAGPTPGICFILTTSRVLLFNIAKRDWKIGRGPLLICAWQHYHNHKDMSLRMTTVWNTDKLILALYSHQSDVIKIWHMQFTHDGTATSVLSSELSTCRLPGIESQSSVLSVSLKTCETAGKSPYLQISSNLVQVIVQCEDLAVFTIVAKSPWLLKYEAQNSGKHVYDLCLPPSRSVQRSERYVDALDDEDELEGFIVPDEDTDLVVNEIIADTNDISIMRADACKPAQKDLSRIAHFVNAFNDHGQEPKNTISGSLQTLEQTLQKGLHSGEHIKALTLSEMFEEQPRVDDIEEASAHIERFFQTLSEARQDQRQTSVVHQGGSRSLSETHDDLFAGYIESLPAEVSDRARVQRNRLLQNLAVDISLSSRTVHRLVQHSPQTTRIFQPGFDHSPLLFSDPIIEQPQSTQPSRSAVSASQPQSRSRHDESEIGGASRSAAPVPSPLVDVLARLSTYVPIAKPPPQASLDDAAISTHISSLLKHLPNDAHADPDEYDWQATELALAVEKAGGTEQQDSGAQRKAAKLVKARKRAESRAKDIARRVPPIIHEEPVHGDVLPIRSSSVLPQIQLTSTGRNVGAAGRPNESQPQRDVIMSDDVETGQIGSSDQYMSRAGGMTFTQPERGPFANRVGTGNKGKAKKKRRVAGF